MYYYMNQSLYKKRYDPELGIYVKKHIHGEGMADVLKSIGSKLFSKTVKEGIKKGSEKAIASAVEKSGNYASKKAGDKIVQLLSKKNKGKNDETSPLIDSMMEIPKSSTPLSQYEINERVNQILSGGKLRRKMKY